MKFMVGSVMKINSKHVFGFLSKFALFIILWTVAETGMVMGQQSVTFALLTDLHVNPGSVSDTSLHLIVDEINHTDVDFTVVLGDLSNTGSDPELLAVKKALDKLVRPVYVLPGNHETNWSESAGLTFNKLWGDDRFLFDYHGYQFIGFNTGPFMKMGDGHVKQEDLRWMKQQLQQKKFENEILISFTHYPLNDGLDDWIQVTDILKSFGCRIAFCGHGHRMALFNFSGITGIMGRSVLSGNSTLPGYNIVRLRNDSVLVYNKEISGLMRKAAIGLNYIKPDALSLIANSPMPDFSVNKIYSNRSVVAEWADSASIFSGPCLVNDTILVYGNSLGYITAMSTISKKIRWQKKISGPVYSTPLTLNGMLVLGTMDGSVIGLDALSGKQVWAVKTGRPILAEGIAEDGFAYIGGGDRSFYKIDIQTGKIIWQFTGVDGLIQGKPAISDSSVVFGAWDRHLYCLDKTTGSLRWKWNNGKPQELYSPGNIFPVCSKNRVFIVAPDRFMTAIDLSTGNEIWRTNRHQVRESMGASPDGSLVYAKLMNDTLIAVSASENFPETLWTVDVGFGYEHNPCPVTATGDMVIVGTRNGILIAIDPDTKKVIWKYKAGNSSVNKIVADQHQTYWCTLMEGKILGIKTIQNHK
jgi:outer membrane protein assembly factor BamB/predicted MPP superfamily phosphohydrolase